MGINVSPDGEVLLATPARCLRNRRLMQRSIVAAVAAKLRVLMLQTHGSPRDVASDRNPHNPEAPGTMIVAR